MPLPLDHSAFWPPKVYSADQRWHEDKAMGVQGDRPPYLSPGSYFVYFSRSDAGPSGGVYNLTHDQAQTVVEHLEKERDAPFEALVGDMPGVGYGYRNENLLYVEPSA